MAKIKAPINKKGIRNNDCKEIITKFWIWVMSLVSRTTRFPAENFSILPNEKVWILRKASSRISALTPCATLAEKIVLMTPATSPNTARPINWTPIDFISLSSSLMIASNTCCSSFGCHNVASTMTATETSAMKTAPLYFFTWRKTRSILKHTPLQFDRHYLTL